MSCVVVGSTTIDVYATPEIQKILPGGGGFHAAMSLAFTKGHATALTTYSRPVSPGAAQAFYHFLSSSGIELYAQPNAVPAISLYETNEAIEKKKPTRQIRYEDFVFNPMEAARALPHVVSSVAFLGSPTVAAQSFPYFIRYAEQLVRQGIPVAVNCNARKNTDQSLLKEWGRVAQIVTLSRDDIAPMFGENMEVKACGSLFLGWGAQADFGTKIVLITNGEHGVDAMWKGDRGKIQHACFSLMEKAFKGENQAGAGDAFMAGTVEAASALHMHATTMPTEALVSELVSGGQKVSAAYLNGRADKLDSLGSLMKVNPQNPQQVIGSFYPQWNAPKP